jgi:hypothetical protein
MELSHENEFSIVLKIEKTVEHAKLVFVSSLIMLVGLSHENEFQIHVLSLQNPAAPYNWKNILE